MWDFLHNHSGSCFLTLSQPSLGFLGLWLVGIITYIVRERHAFCFHVYWHCIHTYIVHTYIHSTSYGIRMLAPKLLAPSSKWRKQNSGSSWVVRREGGELVDLVQSYGWVCLWIDLQLDRPILLMDGHAGNVNFYFWAVRKSSGRRTFSLSLSLGTFVQTAVTGFSFV